MMATALTTTSLSSLLPTTPPPVPPTPPWINATATFIAAIITTTSSSTTTTVSSTITPTVVTQDYPAPLSTTQTLSSSTTSSTLAPTTPPMTTITSSPPDPRRGIFPTTPSSPSLFTDRTGVVVRPSLNATSSSPEGDPHFPTYIRVWASVVVVVILVVGVTGNALVPLLVWRNRDLRYSTNLFLINLALADTLVLLVCLPTVLVELHSPPETWVLGPVMCKLVPFLELVVAHASVLTIVVISVERYVSICQPLRSPALCTRPRAAILNALVWVLTVLATLPMLWLSQLSTYKYFDGSVVYICLTPVSKEWQRNYYLGSVGVFFVLPLGLLLVLYTLIVARLIAYRQRTSRDIDSPLWKSRKQVVAMLAAVVAVFFVCLLPFRVFVVWIILAPERAVQLMGLEVYYNVLYVCRVLIYINSAANPIIYNAMSSKFRSAFQRLLGRSPAGGKPLLRRQSTLTASTSTTSSGFSFRRRSSDTNSRKASLIRALLRKEDEISLAVEEERRAWGVAGLRRVPQESDVTGKGGRLAVEESEEEGRDDRSAVVPNGGENNYLHSVAPCPSTEHSDVNLSLNRRREERVGVSDEPPYTGIRVQAPRDATSGVPKKVSFDDDPSKDHGGTYSPPLRGGRRVEGRDKERLSSFHPRSCLSSNNNTVRKLAVSSRRDSDFRRLPAKTNSTNSFVVNNKNETLPGIIVSARPKLVTAESPVVKDSLPSFQEPVLLDRLSSQEEPSSKETDLCQDAQEQQQNRVSYYDNNVSGEETSLLYTSRMFVTEI